MSEAEEVITHSIMISVKLLFVVADEDDDPPCSE